jgi:opacity protein-like surface antigen
MRHIFLLAALVCLFSTGAAAQDYNSRIDLFAGYSFVHAEPGAELSTFNANGGVGSVALNFTNFLAGVVEVGGVHATNIGGADVDATAETVMAGPKIMLFHSGKFSPFAQALFGFVHTNPGYSQQLINHNTFSMAPGIGLDWNATRHIGFGSRRWIIFSPACPRMPARSTGIISAIQAA